MVERRLDARHVLASLPQLIVSIRWVLGVSSYSLARAVRDQNRKIVELHHAGLDG